MLTKSIITALNPFLIPNGNEVERFYLFVTLQFFCVYEHMSSLSILQMLHIIYKYHDNIFLNGYILRSFARKSDITHPKGRTKMIAFLSRECLYIN